MSRFFSPNLCIFFVSLLVSLSPVIYIQANRILALDKDVVFHHYQKCVKQTVQAPIIDIAELDQNDLLGLEHDIAALFSKGPDSASQGRIVKIVDVPYGSPKIRPVELLNYPKDVAFRPFGLFYEDGKVYVLNQALHQGGSRVDLFDYSDDKAVYLKSVVLDPIVGGTFGDLVVHKNYIYLNQYSQIPFEQTPNPLPLINILKQFYYDIVQTHEAGIYRCPLQFDSQVNCTLMKTGKSASVTALTKDSEKHIWAAFSSVDYNWVERYEIGSNGQLVFSEKLPLRDKAERLVYSPSVDRVYGAAVPWPFMIMTSSKVPSGSVEIRKLPSQDSFNQRRVFMQEDLMESISVSARAGNYVFCGTFMANSVLVCPVVDP